MLTESEIKTIIEKEKFSKFQTQAKTGAEYYEGLHEIRNYTLFYYDATGNLVEDKTRSNIKIAHPFFTELVDQLVQYMLSGKGRFMFSDIPELQDALDEQFNNNDDFKNELNELLTGTSCKGSEYMYLYKDTDGTLRFETADSLGIAEVRAKDTSDNCDYVIRWYVDRIDKDGEKITKIEVWDAQGTTFYIEEGDKGITLDENVKINPRPHTVTRNISDGSLYGSSFGFIPFFRLDNNRKKRSDLSLVKELIDDYDLMSCSLSNNLQDLTEGIYVVRGFTGDNLDELMHNIKTKKTIGVGDGGDIDIKTVNIPYEARKTKMALDEVNIYRFGMGLNSSLVGDGNVTNVVIKSRYILLDLKANKLEARLRKFLKELLRVFLKEKNEENDTAYDISDVKIEFTRETITNDADNASIELTNAQTKQVMINTILNLAQTLDSETVLKKISEVLDLDYDELKDKVPMVAPIENEIGMIENVATLE